MPLAHAVFFLSACTAAVGTAPTVPVWSETTDLNVNTQHQRIFIVPDRHDLVLLTEPDNAPAAKQFVPVKWPLENRLTPAVSVHVTPPPNTSRGGRFRYEYAVSNGKQASQEILFFDLVLPAFAPGTDAAFYRRGLASDLWSTIVGSAVNERQRELDGDSLGRAIVWVGTDEPGKPGTSIPPGHSTVGFTIDSSLMPGFTTAILHSSYVGPPPDEVMDQEIWREVTAFRIEDYLDVSTLTLGPMFLPDAEPADVLSNYRLGVERLRRCTAAPQRSAFLDEVSGILNEVGIEKRLRDKLAQMKVKPKTPVESNLLDCLQLVGRAFLTRRSGEQF